MKVVYQIGQNDTGLLDVVRTIREVGSITGLIPDCFILEGKMIAYNNELASLLIDGKISEDEYIVKSNLLK